MAQPQYKSLLQKVLLGCVSEPDPILAMLRWVTGPGPRHLGLLDSAITAADPRHPGVEIGFVLKEAEIPPGPIESVVNLAFFGLRARGTRKFGALNEVEPKIEPALLLGKPDIDDLPRLSQTEGQGKKGQFIHPGVPFR